MLAMYLESLNESKNERQEEAQMIVDFTTTQDATGENPEKLSTHMTTGNTKNESDDISFEELDARQQELSQLSKQLDDINTRLIEQLEEAGRAVLQSEQSVQEIDRKPASFAVHCRHNTITEGRQGTTIVVNRNMRRERHRRCIGHNILSCEVCAFYNTDDLFDDDEDGIDADLQRMMKIAKKSRKQRRRERARRRARRARDSQRQAKQLQEIADSMLPMAADESAV